MTDRNETIAQALDRLFRTYPQSDRGGSPEDLARDRIERAQVYFEAVEPYETRDIEAAVSAFITGTAPGVNPNFAPPAPAVAAEVRRQMNLRLDHEARIRKPALPPPDIERTPESQARVKARAAELIASLASLSRTDEAAAAYRDRLNRTNERFDRELIAARGYTVGDRDGEAA